MDFQLNLTTESVMQCHPDPVTCLEPGCPVRDVLHCMRQERTGSALICQNGKLIGIFTERDALKMMARGDSLDVPIEQVMNRPDTLSPHDTVAKAIAKMSSGGYRRMAIVDEQGSPVGLVKVAGILHYLVEHFPQVVYTLPPQPHHATQNREGA